MTVMCQIRRRRLTLLEKELPEGLEVEARLLLLISRSGIHWCLKKRIEVHVEAEILYHCCSAKGFSISAEPSTGLMSVMVGPRRTTSPRLRVPVLGSAYQPSANSVHSDRVLQDSPCSSSSTSSSTKLSSWSKPLSLPVTAHDR